MFWDQLKIHSGAAKANTGDQVVSEHHHLIHARTAIQIKDYSAAYKLLSTYMYKRNPDEPGMYLAYDMRALCALHMGRYQQALDDALFCTTLKPESAQAWARLGAAQLCCDHANAAIAAYTKGLAIDTNHQEMLLGIQLAKQAVAAQGGRRKAQHE